MSSQVYTFIVVPDATSQCKRYKVSKFALYVLGGVVTLGVVTLIVVMHAFFTNYSVLSKKVEQVEKLGKIALSQKTTLDHYEEDIAQLSNNLSHIKQLNSRLMILTGLDPEKGTHDLGLGGAEPDAQQTFQDEDEQ